MVPSDTQKLERMQRRMLVVTALLTLCLGVWRGWAWGAAALGGGVLGYLNFRWLRFTVARLLAGGRGRGLAIALYGLKLGVLAVAIAALLFGLGLPAAALLVGIGAMPVAIIVEPLWELLLPSTSAANH